MSILEFKINIEKEHSFTVLYKTSQKEIGEVYMEVDGFYVFLPSGKGAWEGGVLAELGGRLSQLNEMWAKELARRLNNDANWGEP